MRKKFEPQLSIDILPISAVKIEINKRDELPPILKSLQYIFVTPELNREIFQILEEAIIKDKQKTGRRGLDLWQILVLGIVRQGMDLNYDRLLDLANNHISIRQIMGLPALCADSKKFAYSTIKDNVNLLKTNTIEKINEIVVKAGHKMLKKENERLEVKADTYVLETNVHFPSDISLLYDSVRKCLDIIEDFDNAIKLSGWRKLKFWKKEIKKQNRILSKACQSNSKNRDKEIRKQAELYLRLANDLNEKIEESKSEIYRKCDTILLLIMLINLEDYQNWLHKQIDLVFRRLIKGETIPQQDKVYSIFEPHTEWIKKGKANNKVELGHKILVATDQFGFMLTHKVIEKTADVELAIPLADRLRQIYGDTSIQSISFDKGFWSKINKEILQMYIPEVIMPKKGKKNKAEQEEESTKRFKKLRNSHSAIESDINSLEHHGLNRCPDKGKKNFIRYTALGVLSLNIHRLGLSLMEKQEQVRQKLQKAA